MSQIHCQCGKPATIHVTELIEGQKKEIHLCEECAKKKKIFFPAIASASDLTEFLSSLIGGAETREGSDLDRTTCPECGITFAEFRATSRLGCPNDYEVFREGVDPLLERIHGATEHCGSKTVDPAARRRASKLAQFREQLKQAVAEEAYERAARLRDQICALKKELGDEAQ